MSQTPIKVCNVNRKKVKYLRLNAPTARVWVKVNQFSAVKNKMYDGKNNVTLKNGLHLQILLLCKLHQFGL